MPSRSSSEVRALDDAALRAWPLPVPSSEADKEQRGHILVIAGSSEMPGAAVLAATAALRAGAGKLAITIPTGTVRYDWTSGPGGGHWEPHSL